MSPDSFGARRTLHVGDRALDIFALDSVPDEYDIDRLPFSLKILLENVLRAESEGAAGAEEVLALAGWDPAAEPSIEIAFTPARVLMQDFTGVPAIADLAAMRDAMAELGGDPARVEPLVPVELVIDHSVQVDSFGTREAFARNADRDYERNRERYAFLRWGQQAFGGLRVVPPATGIVHQVNLEHLAAWSSSTRRAGSPIRTRSWAPTRTRRWSTALECSAGASEASKRRRRCSASPCRC